MGNRLAVRVSCDDMPIFFVSLFALIYPARVRESGSQLNNRAENSHQPTRELERACAAFVTREEFIHERVSAPTVRLLKVSPE
jgi:hypothetical protein